jgi:hypothetical protein
MARNVDSITKVGSSSKYKYVDGQITYRLAGIKINVKGDNIRITNQYLHPADPQSKITALYGQISEQFGTSTAEEYVEYLIEHDVLFSGGASEVISLPEAKTWIEVGDLSYYGFAEPGSIKADPVWKCLKIDESVTDEGEITWADGNDNYDNIATDLTALTYS